MQACEHVMQSLAGEMIFAEGRGLPWRETIWTGQPNIRLFETAARRALRTIEGVTSIPALTCAIDGNTLRYQATIATAYGTAEIGGTVNA